VAGRFAGMAPRAAAPVAVAQTAGLGAEEARQRVEIARGDQIDVTPGQELAALATGVPIGLTELLPVEKLFRGLDKTLSGAVKLDIANYIKRGLAQGGIEGAQEAASGLLQDLSAKGIYNPNLEVGQSMLGDAALGGSVGFIAQTGLDFLLRKDIGRAYQAKVARDNQKTLNDRLEQMQREKDAQLEQTRKNLNLPDSNILALPAPSPKIEVEGKVDPLMNPVGFVKPEELSPEHLKHINNVRKKEGKKPLNQFSVEDLADAGAPQQELDRILTFKTGYDGRTQLSAQDVLNIAAERNVDTSTVGFLDFLRRSTGAEDLNNMSQPQLFSAFKAIDSLAPGQATQILPPGTNATRFSEDQYNKAMTGLAAEIPKNNMMSRDQAVEAIKQYTGLETDRDAESLLQTAIRSGDYTTVNRTVYELGIPGDPTSPPVRRYTTREAAENAAQRLGLEVRERTHQDVALPGKATQLPGGPDIREGSFKQGVAPAGFEIRSPDAVLQTATTQEEADAKADRLQQLRAQKANGYLGEIAKKNELMQKSQRKLESMEADGKTNTLEYKKMAAGVAAQNKRLQNEIDALKAKVQSYTAPLEIAPKGQKPVARTGFTLFEQNQPVATFPSQQAAEEAAISRLPDETLQNIVKLAPSQKGLMPKRLGKMAEAELRRRRGEEPAGFGVEITGTRAEAEARLAAAGVFTPEFQKAAAELERKLRPLMDKLGLKDLRLNIMRTIKTKDGQSADGYYLQRLIAIAMDADNPMRTLRHEGIHALKELGAFTPQQWQVLENRARSEWMGKYDIANRYKGMGLTQDEMLEEAISDAFSDFDQTKAPPGLIGALFNKIKQFMQAFGNAMNGLGFQTAEDVFTAVEAGGLKPIAAEGAADRIRPSGEDETEKPKYQLSASERETLEQGSFADQTYLRNYDIWQQSFNALPKDIKNKLDAYYVASRKAAVTAQDPGYWDRGARSASTRTFKVASDALEQHFGRQLSTDELAIFLNDWVGSLNERLGKDQTFDRIKYARKSKKFEQTSDLTPLTVEKAKFQEQELEALIKKIGDRIVGMKSGETLDNVRQAVEKLQSYTAQGLRGRKWYEQSAKAVLDAFNGDPVLAEKFFQIIAITSANTEVAANFTKTTKAWTQFAQGKPIKVGTENENKKIEALLNFGEDWDGRKTNTFYTNLMEAMDGKDSGRSTIDLHMTRMLFDKDAPTDAQYELAENMVRLLASKLNVPARQVQAASWVTQKAKTIFEEYRKKGWKKDLNDLELRQFAFERAAADYSHLMKAKVSALPVTDAMKELSSSIRNRVQTITGEVIPSVQSEMSQVEAIEFDAKDKLTKSIAKQNFIPNIAEALNLTSKVRVTVGSGAYQSKVNPNLIVQLVNPDPDVLKKEALDLANAMSYVFKQDATPFFRADPALVDTGQLGFRFRFDTKTLTPAQQKKILTLLNGKFGADAGFTRVRGNEIVLINFRGEDGQPFLTSDAEFVNGLAELRPQIENIAKLEAQEVFGAESEYPYHDWKSDPVGTGIVQGIYSRGPQRPDLQRRLDSIRESFTERARDAVAETGRDPKFSLRPTEPVVRPSTEGDGISIGERQPGAMTFDGVHYSNTADVPVLFGRRYGSGIRGAEAKRLQYADPRIKNRVYFYIPRENGVMPIPEAGLGGHVYIQRLNNMLGPGPEMSRIMREAMGDSNNFESGVVDAGYDGYAVPSMGMMVVLNNDVPVQYRGTRDQIRQKPDEEKVQIGDRRYALRQTDTPEFKKWFGDSKVVDADGKPLVVYHGTTKSFNEFTNDKKEHRSGNPDGFYFTPDADEASDYALTGKTEEGANVIAAYLSIKNPFIKGSFVSPKMKAQFEKELREDNPNLGEDWVQEKVDVFEERSTNKNKWFPGLFPAISFPTEAMTRVLQAGGYDGFKDGRHWIAIEPNQIKSATGNIGTFDAASPDIRYSLRQTNTPEFKKWFGKSTIVDDEGMPKVMYHGLAKDTADFTRKTARGAPIFLTDDPEFAAGFAYDSFSGIATNAQQYLDDAQIKQGMKNAIAMVRKDYGNDTFGKEIIASIQQGDIKNAIPEARAYLGKAFKEMLPTGPHIMPLYVRAERPFDYENPAHIRQVTKWYKDNIGSEYVPIGRGNMVKASNLPAILKDGQWEAIETDDIQESIQSLGFDSFYVKEHGRKNLAVYDPNQVKSAVGNVGTFARDNNDIRYALALKNLDPDSPIVPTEGGNPDGSMGLMPERLNGKPIRMLIGMHNDLIPERDNEKLSKPVSFGANHILNRVLNDPKRMPAGAEELLEKIARTAQRTAQNYNAIYKDGSKFILYDGKNSLIVSPGADEMSIVTMYTQENPNRRYGNPVWVGRAPKVAQFLQPLRGTEVIAAGERVGRKPIPVQTKRVYTPSTVETGEAPVAREPRGKLTLKKDVVKYAIRDSLGQDVVDSIERTTTAREEKGFFQRMGEAISPTAFQKLRQGFINKYDAIERLSKDVAEQFGSKELLADTSAIAAALFSDRAAGVAASSYLNGIPVYKDGFTSVSDMDGQVKGLIPILEPLMKYGDPFVFQAFQYYAATRRGKRLDAEGREKLFTPDDVRKGELLGQQYPEFKQVFDEYQKYNKGLVDFMKATGVISPQEAEIWTQNWDYIPFYRQMDGETTAGPNVFSAISGVAKPKKLKGGTAPLADFMETVIRNSRAAIEAGMKNVAAQRVLRDVVRMDQGQAVPAALARGSDIVTVKEEGQTKYYQVDDPLLVEALKGLNLPQLPFVEVLAAPSNLLRNLVTKDPGFILANLIRDSLQAWVTTGTNITPIVDTFKQYGAALVGTSKEAQALERAGLFAGYDFAADVQSSAREVEAELRKRTGQRTAAETAMLPLSKVWELLDKGSSASDVATRSEVYKRTLAETGNEAEALYQAMEVINFSRKGNSALVRILTAVVPFLNARIQGLDVLYRAGFGKAASRNKERMQKAFITRSLTLMGLSWMYWMMASDTEEYRTAEQEVRDNNWIIGSVRIPIPFEIGTVFKVFPERILEYFMGQDTAKDLKESVFRNLTSTLAFNPIPQAILPFVENVTNYSFFTGQPIVGKGLEDVEKKFQIGSTTSLLAQKIGQETGQSPVQIDNLIRGYTGTLGTYAVMAIDAIMRGEGDPTRATMKAEQLPVLKRFFASPEATGTISAYYDLKNAVDQSTRTINFLERSGSGEDLANYLQDKGAKLQAVKPYIQTLSKEMDQLRDLRRMVQLSQMDPDQKRETLDSIRSAEVAMTRRIQQVKKAVD